MFKLYVTILILTSGLTSSAQNLVGRHYSEIKDHEIFSQSLVYGNGLRRAMLIPNKYVTSDYSTMVKYGQFVYLDTTGKIRVQLPDSLCFDFYYNFKPHKIETSEKFDFQEGYALVYKKDLDHGIKFGLIDSNGSCVVNPVYFDLQPCSESFAAFGLRQDSFSLYGYLDLKNDTIYNISKCNNIRGCDYYALSSFKDGFAFIQETKVAYVIDKKRSKIADGAPFYSYFYSGGPSKVSKHWSPIRNKSINSINNVVDSIISVEASEGFRAAIIYRKPKPNKREFTQYLFLDSAGLIKLVLKKDLEFANDYYYMDKSMPAFYQGRAVVSDKKTGKLGLIDKNGNKVGPFVYDVIGQFSEGLAYYLIHGNYSGKDYKCGEAGYIDLEGRKALIFPKVLTDLYGCCAFYGGKFSNGKALLQLGETHHDCNSRSSILIDRNAGVIGSWGDLLNKNDQPIKFR